MRKLLYIPIIHAQSDLGSLGPAIEGVSASLVGASRWARHKTAVAGFWKAIEDYLTSVDAKGLKIYQDGLAAEGELGRKVVAEAARRGSKNHQIVLALMDRGAEIRKTEDVSLLLEEGRRLLEAVQERPPGPKTSDRSARERDLTGERDRFAAARINETLKEGETGVLFMGAYHDILSHLSKDILVTPVKDRDKILAYFQGLLAGDDDKSLEQLAGYIASPVKYQDP
ncbi:MAG: hypothetical protein Q8P59_01510 [Dehalococcoidia bacterium]|nr:hypothetical protein [Dehalococcoidia bacterium]